MQCREKSCGRHFIVGGQQCSECQRLYCSIQCAHYDSCGVPGVRHQSRRNIFRRIPAQPPIAAPVSPLRSAPTPHASSDEDEPDVENIDMRDLKAATASVLNKYLALRALAEVASNHWGDTESDTSNDTVVFNPQEDSDVYYVEV